MKRFIVTDRFLDAYKQLFEDYGGHPKSCSASPLNMISEYDQCDCGLSSRIHHLKTLSETDVTSYEE